MNNKERIERYGEEAYIKWLKQSKEWHKSNSEKRKTWGIKWRRLNWEKTKIAHEEQSRKGGKYYEYKHEYDKTGLQGERNRIRISHANQYRPYKMLIAPDSQIHHQWVQNRSKYVGVALVEKDQHMHGYIDVIEILDGKITLFTEEDIRSK